MPIKCFMLTITDQSALYLRRYVSSARGGWKCEEGFHQAMTYIENVYDPIDPVTQCHDHIVRDSEYKDSLSWPIKCNKCSYEFEEKDERQVFKESIYTDDAKDKYLIRPRQSEFIVPGLKLAGPGAMWDAPWIPWKGSDGKCLTVITPDGWEWTIDGRASNCTMKEDTVHRCWVRHGVPPDITVDKIGNTCAAGAGSIGTPNWHGFLRNGFLVE